MRTSRNVGSLSGQIGARRPTVWNTVGLSRHHRCTNHDIERIAGFLHVVCKINSSAAPTRPPLTVYNALIAAKFENEISSSWRVSSKTIARQVKTAAS